MKLEARYCMWCKEPLTADESLRPVQGHFPCSFCAILDGCFERENHSMRESAKYAVLDCLRLGVGFKLMKPLTASQRMQFRPSAYFELPREKQDEIDGLLQLSAIKPDR